MTDGFIPVEEVEDEEEERWAVEEEAVDGGVLVVPRRVVLGVLLLWRLHESWNFVRTPPPPLSHLKRRFARKNGVFFKVLKASSLVDQRLPPLPLHAVSPRGPVQRPIRTAKRLKISYQKKIRSWHHLQTDPSFWRIFLGVLNVTFCSRSPGWILGHGLYKNMKKMCPRALLLTDGPVSILPDRERQSR